MQLEYYLDDIESCECIGQFEDEYVYDIEIDDDTHTFIGNDILVHNSLYITMSPLMRSCNFIGDELKFILHLNGNFIKFKFIDFLEEYSKPYGVKNLHDFELETINHAGLHIQKKHYINSVIWEDGVFYEPLSHYYPKGVEIVRSSTPAFVRENIWEFIGYLFKHPDNVNVRDILKIMKELKKQFKMAPIEDISMTTSLSNYESKVIDDQKSVDCVKGAHFSVKAAAFHNFILNKNSEFKTRFDLLKGGKVKYYICQHPLNDKFAYLRNFHPTELCEKENIVIDYDAQFEKTFLAIANRVLEPIGLPPINKRLSVLNSLFSVKTDKPKEAPKKMDDTLEPDKTEEFGDFWSM